MERRRFNFADALLLQHTGKVLEGLKADLAQFNAFDADLDEEYRAQLKEHHITALREGGDDMAKGKVGVKMQVLADEMDHARKVIKDLRYWANKAVGDDPAALERFNFPKFWKIYANQAKLIAFMHSLAKTVEVYRDRLAAAGAKEAFLVEVKGCAEALQRAYILQENAKGGRKTATQNRINLLNTVYIMDRRLANAAKNVFDDDPIRRKFYQLPRGNRPVSG